MPWCAHGPIPPRVKRRLVDPGVAPCLLSGQPLAPNPTSPSFSDTPVVVPLTGDNAVAVGGGTQCVAAQPAGVQCRGQNLAGALGTGTSAPQLCFGDDCSFGTENWGPVNGPSGPIAGLAAGGGTGCAIRGPAGAAGSLWCWGQDDHGQLGNQSTVDSSIPVRVGLPSD